MKPSSHSLVLLRPGHQYSDLLNLYMDILSNAILTVLSEHLSPQLHPSFPRGHRVGLSVAVGA